MPIEPSTSPTISGLRFEADGVFISFHCESCGENFEAYLSTIGSLAIGKYQCLCCGYSIDLWPNDFEKALSRLFPELTDEDKIQLTEEATRITETWYRIGPMAKVLSYKGINLGEGVEREVMPIVLQGLYQARHDKEHDF